MKLLLSETSNDRLDPRVVGSEKGFTVAFGGEELVGFAEMLKA